MNRNQQLKAARLWMHDRQCTGGKDCVGRDDHAKRTQHQFARDVSAAVASGGDVPELAEIIHDRACYAHMADGCPNRGRHIESAYKSATSLAAAVKGAS